ncbi:8-oxo-dGTP diphosphatase, partial [Cryomyces antarcticus]
AAIARLRAYVPPPTQYHSLPLSRRAAVLILLFADRKGDLRVVLTMRASTLKSCETANRRVGEHSAKRARTQMQDKLHFLEACARKADALSETPFQTARREAYEEIGLPLTDTKLPPPFKVEHLTELPANLAKTELGVRPCVAFLSASSSASSEPAPDVEKTMLPRLDAKEVAAVFSAPFHNFLRAADEASYASAPASTFPGIEAAGFPADWYKGTWTNWHESRWRMHNFYVPVAGQTVTKPKPSHPHKTQAAMPYQQQQDVVDHLEGLSRYRVFGMTARILVDAARVAYAEEPEFEHNAHFGDEEMIGRLMRMGRLGGVRRRDDELTREDLIAAAKL